MSVPFFIREERLKTKIGKIGLASAFLLGLIVNQVAANEAEAKASSEESSVQASSSKVEKSSTSESKSSSSSKSSKSATSSVKIPEIVLLTDDEIDNAKTIGDMKTLYSKLVDNYKKYAQDLGDQIPESHRSIYTQQVEPALKTLDESKTQFDTALSTGGSDDTVVPEQGRTVFAQQLKSGRDTMKQALESAYKMVAPYTSAQ